MYLYFLPPPPPPPPDPLDVQRIATSSLWEQPAVLPNPL